MFFFGCNFTEELAHSATYMLDRLQTSSSDSRISAVDLCTELALEADEVWAIYEHLVNKEGAIAFSLYEPDDGIFSPIKDYWMNPTPEELLACRNLLRECSQALYEDAEAIRIGQMKRYREAVN